MSVLPIGDRWFTRQPMDDAITLLAEQFTDPLIRCNIWHVRGRDVLDLGDRAFVVLHVPGHSSGSIALWDAGNGVLFSGDTVYDGGLLDTLPGSDIEHYRASMRRLRQLPVEVVHGGHEPSFGRARLVELVDDYLRASDRVASAP